MVKLTMNECFEIRPALSFALIMKIELEFSMFFNVESELQYPRFVQNKRTENSNVNINRRIMTILKFERIKKFGSGFLFLDTVLYTFAIDKAGIYCHKHLIGFLESHSS